MPSSLRRRRAHPSVATAFGIPRLRLLWVFLLVAAPFAVATAQQGTKSDSSNSSSSTTSTNNGHTDNGQANGGNGNNGKGNDSGTTVTPYTLCNPNTQSCGGPPTARFSPASGAVISGTTFADTITWCASYALNSGSRVVNWNGSSVTSTYATTTLSGCTYAARVIVTGLPVQLGTTNSIDAQITDANGNLGDGGASYTSPSPWVAPVITALDGTPSVRSQTDQAYRFQVKNTGTLATTYLLRVSCSGSVTACTAPTTVTLQPGGGVAEARVSYTTANVLSGSSSGTISLTAIAQPDTTKRATANASVTVTALPVLETFMAGVPRERSQCLAFGIRPELSTQCGNIRITHALPAVRSRNAVRAPVLLYSTDWVQNASIITIFRAPGTTLLDSVQYSVQEIHPDGSIGNTSTKTYPGSYWTATAREQALTVGFGAPSTTILKYRAIVSYWPQGVGTPTVDTLTDQMAEISRISSNFGGGWWLAGVEQIVTSPYAIVGSGGPSEVLWVGGDGSAKPFVKYRSANGIDYYGTPSITRPDTLQWNTFSNQWLRLTPHGDSVVFDSYGRHIRTASPTGTTTRFYWAAGGAIALDSLTLPGSFTYQFHHHTSGADTIFAPGVSGQRLTVLQHADSGAHRGFKQITDPDGSSVKFGIMNWGPYWNDYAIGSMTDRRNTTTSLSWEGYTNALRQASTPTGHGAVLQTFYTPMRGWAPSTPPIPPSGLYFAYDGPRPDVNDVDTIWVNGYGAPIKVKDAIGRVTTVKRQDSRFPGVVTETVSPTGFVSRAIYDAEGNLDTAVALNPYGDGRDAVSTYDWDLKWNRVSTTTTAEGVVTNITYDATTGNRTSQITMDGSSGMYRFSYVPLGSTPDAGLLRKASSPPVNGRPVGDSTIYTYDGLGNLQQVRSAEGRLARYESDGIGRLTVSRAQQIWNDTTNWQDDSVQYDLADRVKRSVKYVPAWNGDAAKKVTLTNSYDIGGLDTSTTEQATPDDAHVGVITRKVRFDLVGRAVAQIAADGQVDSTYYDLAGNDTLDVTRRKFRTTNRYDALNRVMVRRVPAVSYAKRAGDAIDRLPGWTLTVGHVPMPWYRSADDSLHIPADSDTFAYDQLSGALAHAENSDALVRRSYYPNGALRADTLKVRGYVNRADTTSHVYGVQHAYDLDGRETVIHYPRTLLPSQLSSDSVAYGYDAVGNLTSVIDLLGNRTIFQYDARDRRTRTYYPGGVIDSVNYDGDDHIVHQHIRVRDTSMVVQPILPWADSTLRAQAISYDAAGRMTSSVDTAGGNETVTDVYDLLGQLKTHLYSIPAYDAIGNRANLSSNESYSMDAMGNRYLSTVWTTGGNAFHSQNSTNPTSTTYDGASTHAGRLEWVHHDVVSDSSVYDAAGNVVYELPTWPDGQAVSPDARTSYFDASDRLRASDHRVVPMDASGASADWSDVFEEYRYDPLGRRVLVRTRSNCRIQRCQYGTITRTAWDGDQVLFELRTPGGDQDSVYFERDTVLTHLQAFIDTSYYDPNTRYGRVAYTHALGLDQPLAITRMGWGDSVYNQPRHVLQPFNIYPLWDWRGHADFGSAADGGAAYCYPDQSYCVRPYWEHQVNAYFSAGGMDPNGSYWYGQILHDNLDGTGIAYRRNRYLDPASGRFTQEDPLGLGGGLNVYGYAGGDPIDQTDPFGLFPCPELCGGAAALAMAGPGTLAAAGGAEELVPVAGQLIGTATLAVAGAWALYEGAKSLAMGRSDNDIPLYDGPPNGVVSKPGASVKYGPTGNAETRTCAAAGHGCDGAHSHDYVTGPNGKLNKKGKPRPATQEEIDRTPGASSPAPKKAPNPNDTNQNAG